MTPPEIRTDQRSDKLVGGSRRMKINRTKDQKVKDETLIHLDPISIVHPRQKRTMRSMFSEYTRQRYERTKTSENIRYHTKRRTPHTPELRDPKCAPHSRPRVRKTKKENQCRDSNPEPPDPDELPWDATRSQVLYH